MTQTFEQVSSLEPKVPPVTTEQLIAKVEERLSQHREHYDRHWGNPSSVVLYSHHYILALLPDTAFTVKQDTREGKSILRTCTDRFPAQYTERDARLLADTFSKKHITVAMLDKDWYKQQIEDSEKLLVFLKGGTE